jgi:hypothetical protein
VRNLRDVDDGVTGIAGLEEHFANPARYADEAAANLGERCLMHRIGQLHLSLFFFESQERQPNGI